MRRLPPLNAVRAFEAAARHLSFNRAAEELHVTPSAVSHQIRTLEDYLGTKLFERRPRQVQLTAAGRDYLPAISAALDGIDAAGRRLQRIGAVQPLTLGVAPTFATGWLIPHLPEFHERHPDVDVRLTLTSRAPGEATAVDFAHGDIDVAIVYGIGEWKEGVRSHRVLTEELVPVCSPRLLEGPNGLRRPEDLAHATLLHALPRPGQWRNWLMAAGVTGVDPQRGLKFQTTPLALEAAEVGAGVAIANRPFVADELEDGRLVIPFEVQLPSEAGYYLLYPENRSDETAIATFRDWLLEVMEREEAGPSAVGVARDARRA